MTAELKVCICVTCGKSFETDHRRKYCTSECNPHLPGFKTRVLEERICQNPKCGKSFTPARIIHKHCCRKCRDYVNSTTPKKKEGIKRWLNKTGKKYYERKILSCPIFIKVCPITKNVFVSGDKHAVCSPEGKEIKRFIRLVSIHIPIVNTFICAECGVSCSSATRTMYCGCRCANRVRKRKAKALRKNRLRNTTTDNISVHVVLLKYGYQCASCGCDTPIEHRGTYLPTAPELDHIIPLSKGGTHTYNNIQLLCRQCNADKSDKTIDAIQ